MDADQYLAGLLRKYQVDTSSTSSLMLAASQDILPVLQQWRGAELLDVRYSGSIAKGTAVAGFNDMDLFVALRSGAQGTLEQIYRSLFNVARQFWPAREQNVSVGIECRGHRFDLVPARLQQGYQNWYSLWRNKARTWTQTNVDLHIQTIAKSGRADEIRLVKLWRNLAGLEFPSFALELAVIEALKGRSMGALAANLWAALTWIRDNIQTVTLFDPANTNNVVSDDMTAAEKRAVSQAAARALASQYYSDFVW
jgi:hypothetical protein